MTTHTVDQSELINAAIEYLIGQRPRFSPFDDTTWTRDATHHMVCHAITLATIKGLNQLRRSDFVFGGDGPETATKTGIEGEVEGSMGGVIVYGETQTPQVIEMSALILPIKSLSQTIQRVYKDIPRTERAWLLFPMLDYYSKINRIQTQVERAFRQGCQLAGKDHRAYVVLFFAKNMRDVEALFEFLFKPGANKLHIESFGAAMKVATYGALTGFTSEAGQCVVTGACVEDDLRTMSGVGWIDRKILYKTQEAFKGSTFMVASQSTDLPTDAGAFKTTDDILDVISELGWMLPSQQYINHALDQKLWEVEDFFTPAGTECPLLPFDLKHIDQRVLEGTKDTASAQDMAAHDVDALTKSLREEPSSKCTFLLGFGGNGKSMLLRRVATQLAATNDIIPIVVNLKNAKALEGLGGIKALIQYSDDHIAPHLKWLERDTHFKDIILLVDGWDNLTDEVRHMWLNTLETSAIKRALIVSRFENKPDEVNHYWQLDSLSQETIATYIETHEAYMSLPLSTLSAFTNRMTLRMAIWVLTQEEHDGQVITITQILNFITNQLFERGMVKHQDGCPALFALFPTVDVDEYRRMMSELALFWVHHTGYEALTFEAFERWHHQQFGLQSHHATCANREKFIKMMAFDAHILSVEPQTETLTALHSTFLSYFASQAIDTSGFDIGDDQPPDAWLNALCDALDIEHIDLCKPHWLDVQVHLIESIEEAIIEEMFLPWLIGIYTEDNQTTAIQRRLATELSIRLFNSQSLIHALAVSNATPQISMSRQNLTESSINSIIDEELTRIQSAMQAMDIHTNEALEQIEPASDELLSLLSSININAVDLLQDNIDLEVETSFINPSTGDIHNAFQPFLLTVHMLIVGVHYRSLERYAESIEVNEQALTIIKCLYGLEHTKENIIIPKRIKRHTNTLFHIAHIFHQNAIASQAGGDSLKSYEYETIAFRVGQEAAGLRDITINENTIDGLMNHPHILYIEERYLNRCAVLMYNKKFEEAIEHGEVAWLINKRVLGIDDDIQKSVVQGLNKRKLISLGTLMDFIASSHGALKHVDQAHEYYQNALKFYTYALHTEDILYTTSIQPLVVEHPDVLATLATLHGNIAHLYGDSDNHIEALKHNEDQLTILQALTTLDEHCTPEDVIALKHVNSKMITQLANAWLSTGMTYKKIGNLAKARSCFKHQLTITMGTAGIHVITQNTLKRIDVEKLKKLLTILKRIHSTSDAETDLTDKIQIFEHINMVDHILLSLKPNFGVDDIVQNKDKAQLFDLAMNYGKIGKLYSKQKLHHKTLRSFEQKITILRGLMGLRETFTHSDVFERIHNNDEQLIELAVSYLYFGDSYSSLKQPQNALISYQRAFDITKTLTGLADDFTSEDARHLVAKSARLLNVLKNSCGHIAKLYKNFNVDDREEYHRLIRFKIVLALNTMSEDFQYADHLARPRKLAQLNAVNDVSFELGEFYERTKNANAELIYRTMTLEIRRALVHVEEHRAQKTDTAVNRTLVNLAIAEGNVGLACKRLERYEDALRHETRGVSMLTQIVETQPTSTVPVTAIKTSKDVYIRAVRNIIISLGKRAALYKSLGQVEDERADLEQKLSYTLGLLGLTAGFELSHIKKMAQSTSSYLTDIKVTYDRLIQLSVDMGDGEGEDAYRHQKSVIDQAFAPVTSKVKNTSTVIPKVGANDLCPCGSGKKYKACHRRIHRRLSKKK